MSRRDDFDTVGAHTEIDRRRVQLESAAKFRFFFVGLIFAILSFAIQFPVDSGQFFITLLEVSAWGILAVTGILALIDAGALPMPLHGRGALPTAWQIIMWVGFVLGIALLLVSKSWAAFNA